MRERLEAALVDEVLDELRVGDDEAKALGETLPLPGDQQELPVAVVVQDRLLRLSLPECEQSLQQRLPVEDVDCVAGVARGVAGMRDDDAADTRKPEWTHDFHPAEHTRQRFSHL